MKTPFALRKPALGWRTACLAAASAVALTIAGCGSSGSSSANYPVEANINAQTTAIGGATAAAVLYDDGTTKWTLYSMSNRLAATKIGITKDTAYEIALPGYIQRITHVTYDGKNYALVAMGGKGLAVVDLTDPTAMKLLNTVNVNYYKDGLTWVDGGGTPVTGVDAIVQGTAGSIADALVDNRGTPTDYTDDQLFIANGAYGIHKTLLSNLLANPSAPVLDADNLTLKVDSEVWTLHYAGENPWGGPESLKLNNGKLYAALGYLGIGVYDPLDLSVAPARYNLYTDETVNEDWFGSRKLSTSIQNPTYIDATTGMPTWEQARWEIDVFWRTNKMNTATCVNSNWCTPWASFDRYGKYYYKARTLDVVDLPAAGGKPARTMAYIAYSLGGLVAVDLTTNVKPTYDGYIAAVPAHGPDEPTGTQTQSVFPHFGSGMLKEAGVIDVRILGGKAYYSDHFAGLVIASGSDDPQQNWHNSPAPSTPYDNDIFPADPYWPDYEFVTSYDMTPVTPLGSDETIPRFVSIEGGFLAPVLVATGEISGHGGALFLMPTMNTAATGQVDVVQATGAGGLNFIDIKSLATSATMTDYFEVPVRHVSTTAVGAAPDGSATQLMAIGHAEGIAVSGGHVYLADGPHGMSTWRINGDSLGLVANTLQSEYPSNGILPTPHAFGVGFGADPNKAYVMNQSLGMRRVDVSAVAGASVGAPKLLTLTASDIFEHSTDLYTVDKNLTGINSQDHAYGVAFTGNYAVVADGGNGMTVYDVTKDPALGTSAHVVANIGGTATGRPPLGRSSAVKLWTNPATNKKYAVVAAGSYGVSVVEMTDLLDKNIKPGLTLIKTFEPKKYDEDKVGSADGKSVDVHIVGNYAFFSYDSFGLVAYKMADLIQPVVEYQPVGQPAGACADVTDVTALSAKQGRTVDCRPESVGRFKLQTVAGYETVDGGALYMTPQYFPANTPFVNASGSVVSLSSDRVVFFVGYGDAGVVKLDWSNPAAPVMIGKQDTMGAAAATAVANGRVYVADGTGGMLVFK